MSNRLLNLAFNCRESRGTARLALLAIADRINDETGICWSSYADLMRRCHCSRGVLAGALKELRESKVLISKKRHNTSTLYSLDSELLESLAYPVSTEAELHESSDTELEQFGCRTAGSSYSDKVKFGFPNANPTEPPVEPNMNRRTTTHPVSVVDPPVVSHSERKTEQQEQPIRKASPSEPSTGTSRPETHGVERPAKAGESSAAPLPLGITTTKTGKFKLLHEHSSACSKGCGLHWDVFEVLGRAIAEAEARMFRPTPKLHEKANRRLRAPGAHGHDSGFQL